MSKWSLIGNSSHTDICVDKEGITLSGHGMLDYHELYSELTSKGAPASCWEPLKEKCAKVNFWIFDDVKYIKRGLQLDAITFTSDRAKAANELVIAASEQDYGVINLGQPIMLAFSPARFERIYRLFESAITCPKASGFSFSLQGEFEIGVEKIQDHHPTPEQFLSGAPLLSLWVRASFYARIIQEPTA